MKLSFVVPGNPIPWKRAETNGKRRYNHPSTEAWKAKVFREAWNACQGYEPCWYRDRAYRVSVTFYRKNETGTDLDRLMNAVLDGMEGAAYVADRQVKGFGKTDLLIDRKNPRAVVTVEAL